MQMETDAEKIVRFLLDRGIKAIKIYPYEKIAAGAAGTYVRHDVVRGNFGGQEDIRPGRHVLHTNAPSHLRGPTSLGFRASRRPRHCPGGAGAGVEFRSEPFERDDAMVEKIAEA